MTSVLVVEDDPTLLRGITDNLKFEDFSVFGATDGETAYRLIHNVKPDVVVLDLMLPRMSGYELCRKLRSEGSRVPILMLSARGEEADRVLGLDLGADDYMSKPFSVRELMARVRALARRTEEPVVPDRLKVGKVAVDFRRFEATVDGKPIQMTPKEFAVLRVLVGRAGEVVTRDSLLREVWGFNVMPTTRTVDNHVALLRAKLEEHPAEPRHLVTVHGIGYRWIP